jgi:hypothetical protein
MEGGRGGEQAKAVEERNPVGKVSLKGAGVGRAAETSSFFFIGDFLFLVRRLSPRKER